MDIEGTKMEQLQVKKEKCFSSNFVMAEAVPFGQHWTYHSNHSIAEMMNPEYFTNMEGQLRVGDDIRLIKLSGFGEKKAVITMAEVLITQKNPMAFEVIRPPMEISTAHGYDIRQLKDKTWDLVEHGKVLNNYPNKKAATEAAAYFSGESKEKVANG